MENNYENANSTLVKNDVIAEKPVWQEVNPNWMYYSGVDVDSCTDSSIDLIGKGNFGRVFAITNKFTGKLFALKEAYVKTPTQRKAIAMEVKCLKKLQDNPLFLKFFFVCQLQMNDGKFRVRIMMEHFPSQDLHYYLRRRKQKFTKSQVVDIVHQLGRAVSFCHSNKIIHMDIKPDNILLDSHSCIKLIDFNLALPGPENNKFRGTYGFIAPEVDNFLKLPDATPYGYKADYYSIGVTAHELLFNKLPEVQTIDIFHKDVLNDLTLAHQVNLETPGKISPEEQSFLNKLLCPIPSLRLGDDDYLSHPYFRF